MSLPNSKYNSGGVPHGGIFVDVYAPTDPENPNNGATKVGTYRLESCTPKAGSTLTKRPDIDGGPNGWYIVDGDIEGNANFQRNLTTTPTLENGWYFDAGIRIDKTGATVNERFVVHSPDRPIEVGYRKMACSVIVDQYATGVTPRNPLNGA